LAVGAVLVSYDLGERRAFSRDMMTPTTQMVMGPDGVARPYLVQAGQTAYGQPFAGQPYGWSPYATAPGVPYGPVAPYGYTAYPQSQPQYAPARTQYVTERVVTDRPVVRRTQRVASEVKPQRSWQKSALLIGGSAGAGAGLGALMGGKKGALAGAAIGGGSAAIYDQVKRH
jgi:hypothetical protein